MRGICEISEGFSFLRLLNKTSIDGVHDHVTQEPWKMANWIPLLSHILFFFAPLLVINLDKDVCVCVCGHPSWCLHVGTYVFTYPKVIHSQCRQGYRFEMPAWLPTYLRSKSMYMSRHHPIYRRQRRQTEQDIHHIGANPRRCSRDITTLGVTSSATILLAIVR